MGGNLTFSSNCDVGEQGILGNRLDTFFMFGYVQGNQVSYKSCMKCPAGKFASAKFTDVCSDCPKGRYASATGSTSCEACPTGRYNEYTAKSSSDDCIKCALGTYSNLIAAETQFTCQLCDSGTYGDELALAACKDCARGKYSPKNAVQCTNCAPGTYNNVTASMTCHDCASGKYISVPGQTKCVDCLEGEYSGAGSATCQVCTEGKYRKVANTSDAAVACRSCVAGTYSPGAVNACFKCALGKFAAAGLKECANCLAGSYAGSEGSASCSNCAPGKYSDLEGQAKCVDCVNGTFATSSGSTGCTACSLAVAGPGPVTTLAPGASSSLECVCHPEYYQANATPHNLAYREFYPTLTCPVGGSSRCCLDIGNLRFPPSEDPDYAPASMQAYGQTTRDLVLTKGYWRVGEDSSMVFPCYKENLCTGGYTGSTADVNNGSMCILGHRGPYCEVCLDGYAASNGVCTKCVGNAKLTVAMGVTALIVALVVACYLSKKAYTVGSTQEITIEKQQEMMDEAEKKAKKMKAKVEKFHKALSQVRNWKCCKKERSEELK